MNTHTYRVLLSSVIAFTIILSSAPGASAATSTKPTGAITESTLVTKDTTPSLSGTANNAKSVRVLIENAKGKDFYKSNALRLKDGKWKANVGKKLPVGNYTVTLYGPKGVRKETLVKRTLSILPANGATVVTGSTQSSGTLSVSPVALLFGGNAAHGASVPVTYIKVSNTGTASTSISGFTLLETGSAPDSVVIGFTTNDDKGLHRATYGGLESTPQFKNGSAYVPLVDTIGPKQFRIYTIKAMLSQNSGSYYGKQLMINLASVDTRASVSGILPMRGTTWTLVF